MGEGTVLSHSFLTIALHSCEWLPSRSGQFKTSESIKQAPDLTPVLVRTLWRREQQLSAVGTRIIGRVGHSEVALPTVPFRFLKMSLDLYKAQTLLTLRLLMSYIYGAPILDVSRSHTTTQHSR